MRKYPHIFAGIFFAPVQGQKREQATLFPKRLDDLIGEDNAVRAIDAFVDSLDLKALAETINGLCKTEVIRKRGPWCNVD